MWPRLRIDDVRAILYYLGTMLLVIAALMAAPLVVALLLHEWNPAISFTLSGGITTCVALLLRLARPANPGLTHMQALVITGLVWVFAGAVAGLPLYFSGAFANYFDALFEAVSYFTGTGMSVLNNLGHLAASYAIWRALLVVVGAQGIVVVALCLGTISRFSGAGLLLKAEGHSDNIMSQMAGTARFIVSFMGVLIALGTLLCTFVLITSCGLTPGTALLHGFSLSATCIATAGICMQPAGIAYYHSPLLNLVLIILCLVGAFSFALYYRMARKGPREFFRDIETRTILVWIGVVLVVLAIAFAHDDYFGNLDLFLDKGVFNLVSAATSTGFSTISASQVSSVASSGLVFALILGMAMGGATSSTAGGFKAIRLALLLRTIGSEVRHALMPRRAREVIRFSHLGDQVLTPELSRNVMIVVLLYLLSFVVGAVVGVAYGYDPIAAVLESVSCTANCGISAGIVGSGMPLGLQICYFVQMLAGRLEFLTLLTTIASVGGSLGHAIRDSSAARSLASAVPASVRRAWRGKEGDSWRGEASREDVHRRDVPAGGEDRRHPVRGRLGERGGRTVDGNEWRGDRGGVRR